MFDFLKKLACAGMLAVFVVLFLALALVLEIAGA